MSAGVNAPRAVTPGPVDDCNVKCEVCKRFYDANSDNDDDNIDDEDVCRMTIGIDDDDDDD